ncbi:ABC transporter ATP-binding protein [Psychrobacillus antarcticus]|uniref:ABC transporter ATP-binding protein n=1 Tax=Psychrobacillus antarcticus TaxID=2879115 RepID=UPI0024080A94|nr:ABC transporter ATP-binding protein [Psychrobacillus antarcticus]
MESKTILEVKNAGIQFGGLKAVQNLNLKLNQGELVGLIGPNGAGKTTSFNLLTGVYVPTEGDILFNGERINGLAPFKVTRKGISRTFQNIRLFNELSVLDNVKVAYHSLATHTMLSSILRLPSHYKGEKEMEEKSLEFLEIFKLEKYKDELAKNLPYGQQRRLEIARALAAGPQLLLLDEPAAGMNPQETHDLMNLIGFVREKFDLTILLIEHDMNLVMGVCERIYVLDHGQLLAEGSPEEIRNHPKVIEAYLGEEVHDDNA